MRIMEWNGMELLETWLLLFLIGTGGLSPSFNCFFLILSLYLSINESNLLPSVGYWYYQREGREKEGEREGREKEGEREPEREGRESQREKGRKNER